MWPTTTAGMGAPVHDELAALWLLRHGQSLGNVANDAARVEPVERLDIADRDMDVPLSELGVEQAEAFGVWLASSRADERPDVVVSSPYVRAIGDGPHVVDGGRPGRRDRPRRAAARARVRHPRPAHPPGHRRRATPTEAERRDRLGKFYYRPPGGESWVDVALRLRSLRDSLVREHADRRVLVVTHEVPIIITRYLLERLDEQARARAQPIGPTGQLLADDLRPRPPTAGCGSTATRGPRRSRSKHAPVTEEPDAPVAPR